MHKSIVIILLVITYNFSYLSFYIILYLIFVSVMINAVVRSTVMSVMMYISFPRQLSLDNDYHGIQVVLIHIFLLTHIKIHIILKNKFLMIIKAKYSTIK
jgi:hypothetical protein